METSRELTWLVALSNELQTSNQTAALHVFDVKLKPDEVMM